MILPLIENKDLFLDSLVDGSFMFSTLRGKRKEINVYRTPILKIKPTIDATLKDGFKSVSLPTLTF